MASVQDVRNQANYGADEWKRLLVLPYGTAYETAYAEYNDKLKAQADADKERAELLVTVVSVMSGSLLMAAVGQSSLKALAGKVAMDAIARRNLSRTFSRLQVLATDPTFSFALGKAVDTMQDGLKKQVTDAVAKKLASGATITSSRPLGVQNHLEAILLTHKNAMIDAAVAVERSGASGGEKAVALTKLLSAPVCTGPTTKRPINVDALAKRIELGFYMRSVLNSDSMDTYAITPMPGGIAYPVRVESKPINALPSDRNYPMPAAPSRLGQTVLTQSIGLRGLGDKVEERVDELYGAVFNKEKFYPSRGWFEFLQPNQTSKRRDLLRRAESSLDKLGESVRPESLLQTKP